MLFNADVRHNFTLEGINLKKKKENNSKNKQGNFSLVKNKKQSWI